MPPGANFNHTQSDRVILAKWRNIITINKQPRNLRKNGKSSAMENTTADFLPNLTYLMQIAIPFFNKHTFLIESAEIRTVALFLKTFDRI